MADDAKQGPQGVEAGTDDRKTTGKANRRYKNSVFQDLFHNERDALALYNAVSGNRFTDADALRFTTLEGALFMSPLNDLSFTIGDRLVVLVEHQSTVNENMPLRALLYIGRVYERIIDGKAVYRSRLLNIPTPEFYVLYNGKGDYPDEKTLRISDAFWGAGLQHPAGHPMLELEVRVLNINRGRNRKILERCATLDAYAAFVGQVRDRQKAGKAFDDAVAAAIDHCVENGILVEYLKNNRSEVCNMLFTEFNLEDAKEVWFEEGREEGIEEGIEKGREKERFENARAMYAEGDSLEKINRVTKIPIETLKEKLSVH
jgi:hypothetical protein